MDVNEKTLEVYLHTAQNQQFNYFKNKFQNSISLYNLKLLSKQQERECWKIIKNKIEATYEDYEKVKITGTEQASFYISRGGLFVDQLRKNFFKEKITTWDDLSVFQKGYINLFYFFLSTEYRKENLDLFSDIEYELVEKLKGEAIRVRSVYFLRCLCGTQRIKDLDENMDYLSVNTINNKSEDGIKIQKVYFRGKLILERKKDSEFTTIKMAEQYFYEMKDMPLDRQVFLQTEQEGVWNLYLDVHDAPAYCRRRLPKLKEDEHIKGKRLEDKIGTKIIKNEFEVDLDIQPGAKDNTASFFKFDKPFKQYVPEKAVSEVHMLQFSEDGSQLHCLDQKGFYRRFATLTGVKETEIDFTVHELWTEENLKSIEFKSKKENTKLTFEDNENKLILTKLNNMIQIEPSTEKETPFDRNVVDFYNTYGRLLLLTPQKVTLSAKKEEENGNQTAYGWSDGCVSVIRKDLSAEKTAVGIRRKTLYGFTDQPLNFQNTLWTIQQTTDKMEQKKLVNNFLDSSVCFTSNLPSEKELTKNKECEDVYPFLQNSEEKFKFTGKKTTKLTINTSVEKIDLYERSLNLANTQKLRSGRVQGIFTEIEYTKIDETSIKTIENYLEPNATEENALVQTYWIQHQCPESFIAPIGLSGFGETGSDLRCWVDLKVPKNQEDVDRIILGWYLSTNTTNNCKQKKKKMDTIWPNLLYLLEKLSDKHYLYWGDDILTNLYFLNKEKTELKFGLADSRKLMKVVGTKSRQFQKEVLCFNFFFLLYSLYVATVKGIPYEESNGEKNTEIKYYKLVDDKDIKDFLAYLRRKYTAQVNNWNILIFEKAVQKFAGAIDDSRYFLSRREKEQEMSVGQKFAHYHRLLYLHDRTRVPNYIFGFERPTTTTDKKSPSFICKALQQNYPTLLPEKGKDCREDRSFKLSCGSGLLDTYLRLIRRLTIAYMNSDFEIGDKDVKLDYDYKDPFFELCNKLILKGDKTDVDQKLTAERKLHFEPLVDRYEREECVIFPFPYLETPTVKDSVWRPGTLGKILQNCVIENFAQNISEQENFKNIFFGLLESYIGSYDTYQFEIYNLEIIFDKKNQQISTTKTVPSIDEVGLEQTPVPNSSKKFWEGLLKHLSINFQPEEEGQTANLFLLCLQHSTISTEKNLA